MTNFGKIEILRAEEPAITEKETQKRKETADLRKKGEGNVFENELIMAKTLSSGSDPDEARGSNTLTISEDKELFPSIIEAKKAADIVIGNEEEYANDTKEKINKARETLENIFDNSSNNIEQSRSGRKSKKSKDPNVSEVE